MYVCVFVCLLVLCVCMCFDVLLFCVCYFVLYSLSLSLSLSLNSLTLSLSLSLSHSRSLSLSYDQTNAISPPILIGPIQKLVQINRSLHKQNTSIKLMLEATRRNFHMGELHRPMTTVNGSVGIC